LYREHCVAVVVPAYNEEALIGSVLETIPPFIDHIIVVDDHSKDRTTEVVKASNDSRIELHQTPANSGVGGAMALGYRAALERGAQVIVKMDGDGQMSPEHLPALLDAIVVDGYEYAKGNRFLNPDALPQMPKLRLLGNVALTLLTKLASGYWHIFDPQNGYTAISAAALRRLDLDALHRGYFFENDVLVQLAMHDATVRDVAMPAHYGEEISSLSPVRALFTFPLLLTHRFFRRVWHNYVLRDFSPVALFLLLGLPLIAWGGAFGVYTWVRSATTDEFASTGTVMLSVLPFFLGFELLLQAIVLDIQRSPGRATSSVVPLRDRPEYAREDKQAEEQRDDLDGPSPPDGQRRL
jgi:glycosyltransferase involved in cell wall biosynthesis